MKFTVKTGTPPDIATDCLVIPRGKAHTIAEKLGVGDQVLLALEATKNETGEVTKLALKGRPSRLLVVGKAQATSAADYRKDMAAAASALADLDAADATLCVGDFQVHDLDDYRKVRLAFDAVSTACYRFDEYKSKKPKPRKLRRVGVVGTDRGEARRAARHAQALQEGMKLAKDLGNQPPNVCDPSFVAEAARALAGDKASVEVIDEAQMAELGMGAFLSVTQGSRKPAKLIAVHYRGGPEGAAPTVLIGKGITFDTGGTNMKGFAGMADMKFDMCGAASVLGVAKAVIDAELPINMVAMVAAAENMPGGAASRPSDIVTTMSGQTVEIQNTDAEGRLVLCDAMTYAERFTPRAVVDVATLTGAQVTALGHHASALYANDDALAAALSEAGESSADRMWRMPLWDEYQAQLKSNFADMKNIGGRPAGSITAACFLSRFAKAFPWAHLDVAGTAFRQGRSSGRPTPALFEYLLAVGANGG